MTLTLTYDPRLSRVRATASGLDTVAVTGTLERRAEGETRWTVVRGGLDVPLSGTAITVPIDDYEFVPAVVNTYRLTTEYGDGSGDAYHTATITPTLEQPWLKIVARPFLNRPVTVLEAGDVSRSARAGVHEIVGRSFPVVVSDLRSSKSFDLTLVTDGETAREEMDLTLASGEPIFLHVPADCDVPGGYFHVGATRERRPGHRSKRRFFLLPVTEIAAPGPDVIGSTATWTSVLNAYATWQELLDAEATWQELLELIGQPSDVIVP